MCKLMKLTILFATAMGVTTIERIDMLQYIAIILIVIVGIQVYLAPDKKNTNRQGVRDEDK